MLGLAEGLFGFSDRSIAPASGPEPPGRYRQLVTKWRTSADQTMYNINIFIINMILKKTFDPLAAIWAAASDVAKDIPKAPGPMTKMTTTAV